MQVNIIILKHFFYIDVVRRFPPKQNICCHLKEIKTILILKGSGLFMAGEAKEHLLKKLIG